MATMCKELDAQQKAQSVASEKGELFRQALIRLGCEDIEETGAYDWMFMLESDSVHFMDWVLTVLGPEYILTTDEIERFDAIKEGEVLTGDDLEKALQHQKEISAEENNEELQAEVDKLKEQVMIARKKKEDIASSNSYLYNEISKLRNRNLDLAEILLPELEREKTQLEVDVKKLNDESNAEIQTYLDNMREIEQALTPKPENADSTQPEVLEEPVVKDDDELALWHNIDNFISLQFPIRNITSIDSSGDMDFIRVTEADDFNNYLKELLQLEQSIIQGELGLTQELVNWNIIKSDIDVVQEIRKNIESGVFPKTEISIKELSSSEKDQIEELEGKAMKLATEAIPDVINSYAHSLIVADLDSICDVKMVRLMYSQEKLDLIREVALEQLSRLKWMEIYKEVVDEKATDLATEVIASRHEFNDIVVKYEERMKAMEILNIEGEKLKDWKDPVLEDYHTVLLDSEEEHICIPTEKNQSCIKQLGIELLEKVSKIEKREEEKLESRIKFIQERENAMNEVLALPCVDGVSSKALKREEKLITFKNRIIEFEKELNDRIKQVADKRVLLERNNSMELDRMLWLHFLTNPELMVEKIEQHKKMGN